MHSQWELILVNMKSGKTFLNTEIHSGEWKSLYISYCIYCINTVEG